MRASEAFAANNEAADIYRALAERDPSRHLAGCALALSALALDLAGLGRQEEALAVSAETVSIYRALKPDNPALLAQFAGALSNLSTRLCFAHRFEDADLACKQALLILRPLAEEKPDLFEMALAGALASAYLPQSNLGLIEEAFASASESVALYRKAAERGDGGDNPTAIARALVRLGEILGRMRRTQEALAASSEAVAILRDAVTRNGPVFEPDLGFALRNLAGHFASLGRHQEALRLTQETVALERNIVARDGPSHLPSLASALGALVVDYSSVQQLPAALETAGERVRILRTLADGDAQSFQPVFAAALMDFGGRLSAAGRHEEAVALSKEATQLYRGFYEKGVLSAEAMGRGICALGDALMAKKDTSSAVSAYEEGITLIATARRSKGNLAELMNYNVASLARALSAQGLAESEIKARVAQITDGAPPGRLLT